MRMGAQRLAQHQRRVAGALRVIFVRDRCAEERHDAVAGELVHRAFEPMHAVGEDGNEALHDVMPFLRIELLGELHRALHVGEQHGHLLALALEGAARGEDLVDQVRRRVRAQPGRLAARSGRAHRPPAREAEIGAVGKLGSTGRAEHGSAIGRKGMRVNSGIG
jgi:hypothetical protein